MTEDELMRFTSDYFIPFGLNPEVPGPRDTIADYPAGKVGLYTRFFDWANQRVPISVLLSDILNYYEIPISQLHCIGAGKIANFEVNCRLLAIPPTLHLFRAFYRTSWLNGWVTFAKRIGKYQCYTDKVDKLSDWRNKFFWIDEAVFPSRFPFHTRAFLPKDERPLETWYNKDHADIINENRLPIKPYPEEFLVHMGISRNYFEPDTEVPTFLDATGAGGCTFYPGSVSISPFCIYCVTCLRCLLCAQRWICSPL